MGTGSDTNFEGLSKHSQKVADNRKQRIRYIDFIRGVAILSIVWGHVAGGNSGLQAWNHYNNFFKIMIFYVLSGWLLNDQEVLDLKQFCRKKLRALGLPYLIISSIIIGMDVLFAAVGFQPALQIVQDIYRTICLAGIGTLWFLPTLFGAEMLSAFAVRQKKVKIYMMAGGIISISGIIILNLCRRESMLFDVVTAPVIVLLKCLTGFLFMMLGRALRKRSTGKEVNFGITIAVISLSLLVCCFAEVSDYNHLYISNIPLWLAATVLTCVSVFLFSQKLYYVVGGGGVIFRYVLGTIEFFGRNSLIIMSTHYSIVMPFIRGNSPYVNYFCVLAVETAICCAYQFKIINKIFGQG